LAEASMSNFLSVDCSGEVKLDFCRAVERGALGQIKKYKEKVTTTTITPKDSDPEVTVVVWREIEVHDRLPAIQTILKMNGLLTEKHDHTIVITDKPDPIIADPILNKLANEYERRLARLPGGNGESAN
jgi:hypothetical protein